MDEILTWIFDTFNEEMKPYHAVTYFYHPQTVEYWCHGCNGKFISTWPEWIKPTDDTFGHEPSCMYIKAKKAAKWDQ